MAANDFIFDLEPFLPEWLHNKVIDEICNDKFPWHFPAVGVLDEKDPYRTCFGCTLITDKGANYTQLAPSINYVFDYARAEHMTQFEFKRMERLRLNMYAPGQFTSRHIDQSAADHWALLYYITDSDGGTEIEGNEYEHRANRALLFPADMYHQARPSTSPARITANWNFESVFDYDSHREMLRAD
mgnify:CR=1 FL=1